MYSSKQAFIVLGAGVGGLASAIRLKIAGYNVLVLEQNQYPGGKLSSFKQGNYRFDAGPSLFTMPENVEDLFSLAGLKTDDYFKYQTLDTVCHYFWEDGTTFNAPSNPAAFAIEAARVFNENPKHIDAYFKRSALCYDAVGTIFLTKPINRLSTFLSVKALKAYLNLPKLGLLSTMAERNKASFDNPKLTQLFNRFATYNGSDPWQAPALLTLIPHLEHGKGAFFPNGGMVSITNALYDLAKRLGVDFRFGCDVKHLDTKPEITNGKDQRVAGVTYKQDGKIIYQECDGVICNIDMVSAYKTFLSHTPIPKKLLEQPKSSSAVIFYWGIKRQFDALGLHNILFADDYKAEFDAIFKTKTLHNDPTVYINITSKYEASDAPSGSENWFTMVNVPNNSGQDWDSLVAQARAKIIAKIDRVLLKGADSIANYIESESVLDPRTIESRTGSSQGALYGNSSNNTFSAFLRHQNKSEAVSRLYFAGGSVHPGGGVPLALLSGKIAVDMVLEDAI